MRSSASNVAGCRDGCSGRISRDPRNLQSPSFCGDFRLGQRDARRSAAGGVVPATGTPQAAALQLKSIYIKKIARDFPMSAWDYAAFAVAAGALVAIVVPLYIERKRHERTQQVFVPSLREELDRGWRNSTSKWAYIARHGWRGSTAYSRSRWCSSSGRSVARLATLCRINAKKTSLASLCASSGALMLIPPLRNRTCSEGDLNLPS